MPFNYELGSNHDVSLRFSEIKRRVPYTDQLLFVAITDPEQRREHQPLYGAGTEIGGRVIEAAPNSFKLGLPESKGALPADGRHIFVREVVKETNLAFEIGIRCFLTDLLKVDSKRFHPIFAGEEVSESQP